MIIADKVQLEADDEISNKTLKVLLQHSSKNLA